MAEILKKEPGVVPKGIVVAGLSGGSGKSVLAVGLTAAFANMGRKVVPFKKGPDYIDSGWLQLAAGNPCYNLDPYLMSGEAIHRSFVEHSRSADTVIIEGNRGLFDGVDPAGAYSTAELSVSLGMPVLLVVDCTKVTRTVAAMVLGCLNFDPRLEIRGVVLNRIGGARHEKIIRQSIEQYTGVPVFGALPRMSMDVFPQRHLGVTPHQEHEGADEVCKLLAGFVKDHADLQAIEAAMAEIRTPKDRGSLSGKLPDSASRVRIGVIRDAAFQFYYPENFEALGRAGAELVEINAMTAKELPLLDALYIGGGFPETSARELSANRTFRESIRKNAEAGLPIYAECGGLIYLGESIVLDGELFPLAGVLPVRFGLEKKPQAHGYTVLTVDGENPFYPPGLEIKGHEFRYSRVLAYKGGPEQLVLKMERGVGFADNRDGLVYKNVLALYTHVHAVGMPQWADFIVQKAIAHRAAV